MKADIPDIRDLWFLVRRTLSWWLPLAVIMMGVTILASPGFMASRALWDFVGLAVERLGFTVPYIAFVTGVAAVKSGRGENPGTERRTVARVLMAASLLAITGYTLGSVVDPLLEHRADAERGVDLAKRYPFGPDTPRGLLRLRDAVEASPPAEYSFSANNPMDTPPNWLTYQFHSWIALAFLALPNALLGYLVALLTSDFRPIRRRQARWAAGLGVSLLYLAVGMWISARVRVSPDNSGVFAAWLPLLGPCLLTLATWRLVARASENHQADRDWTD